MNVEDINYIALKLDQPSKERLVALIKNLFGDRYQKIYCDHITLAYGEDQIRNFNMQLLGNIATVYAYAIVYDEHCVALPIDKQEIEKFGANNQYPHITLATNDVKPVYSNMLMKNFYNQGNHGEKVLARSIELDDPIRLDAIVMPVGYAHRQVNTNE